MERGLDQIFEKIYNYPKYKTYYSGYGSHDPFLVDSYVNLINVFFKNFDQKPNVIDIGCGDFNIGKQLLGNVNNYYALDVVDSLINYNKIKYKGLNVDFQTLDITKSTIPFTDVILIRQVFQHLSNKDILNALKNIKGKSKYIVITEHIPKNEFIPNIDISSGSSVRVITNRSGVEITKPPFNFPIESEILNLSLIDSNLSSSLIKTTIYKQK